MINLQGITKARGQYSYLASDSPTPLTLQPGGASIPTLLHAFVAQVLAPALRPTVLALKDATAILAFIRERRQKWNFLGKTHHQVASALLKHHFDSSPQQRALLMATYPRRIMLVDDPMDELLDPNGVCIYSRLLERLRADYLLSSQKSEKQDRTFVVPRVNLVLNKFSFVPHYDCLYEDIQGSLYERLLDVMDRHGMWLERSDAEHVSAYKQIIPYIVVRALEDLESCGDDSRILCYERAGDEKRLRGQMSLGIGGHMEVTDCVAQASVSSAVALHLTVQHAIQRELKEEYTPAVLRPVTFKGVINDDVSPVGSVHLGLVFETYAPMVKGAASSELRNAAWRTPAWIARNYSKFETWSDLTIDLLDLCGA